MKALFFKLPFIVRLWWYLLLIPFLPSTRALVKGALTSQLTVTDALREVYIFAKIEAAGVDIAFMDKMYIDLEVMQAAIQTMLSEMTGIDRVKHYDWCNRALSYQCTIPILDHPELDSDVKKKLTHLYMERHPDPSVAGNVISAAYLSLLSTAYPLIRDKGDSSDV
jgi:hypothetical protein